MININNFLIKKESQLHYLPLVYLLPEEIIIRCPTLRKLPRKVRMIINNKSIMEIINSDQFLNEISSAVSWLVFPHFGFRGWVEHYSENNPVWKLSYNLGLWGRMIKEDIDWDLQGLFYISSTENIPFFDSDYVKVIFGRVVKRAIKEQNWQPIIDVIKEMPFIMIITCESYYQQIALHYL